MYTKLVFETKKAAVEFLRNQSFLYEHSKGFSSKGNYYLSHGEYDAPDYVPTRYGDGWGIKKIYHFQSGTFNTPSNGRCVMLEDKFGSQKLITEAQFEAGRY